MLATACNKTGSTALQAQKSYPVAAGTHTITIGPAGTKNGSSSGPSVYFDAFLVGPVASGVGAGTYEDSNVLFIYCCGYHPDLHSFPTRRSSDLTPYSGATASMTFTSTAVTVVF